MPASVRMWADRKKKRSSLKEVVFSPLGEDAESICDPARTVTYSMNLLKGGIPRHLFIAFPLLASLLFFYPMSQYYEHYRKSRYQLMQERTLVGKVMHKRKEVKRVQEGQRQRQRARGSFVQGLHSHEQTCKRPIADSFPPSPCRSIGLALIDSLDELIQSGHINPQLAMRVLAQVTPSLLHTLHPPPFTLRLFFPLQCSSHLHLVLSHIIFHTSHITNEN